MSPHPSTAVELVPIGGSVCLFAPATRATALLNEGAAAIAVVLLEGDAPQAIVDQCARETGASLSDARRAVAAVERGLEAAGFWPSARPPSAVRAVAEPPVIDTTWWAMTCGASPDLAVRLATNDPNLAPLLTAALAPLRRDGNAVTHALITVERHGDGLSVWRDAVLIASGLDLADARRVALQALVMALWPADQVATLLHASAVVIDANAVLLAGATGSGKTTLMMQLVADGAGYLADDLAPLDRTGCLISPFPVAASLKQGSWPCLGDAVPALAAAPIHRVGQRRVRYVDPGSLHSAMVAPAPARLIVFPRFAPDAVERIAPVTPDDALARLLATGTEIVGSPRSIRPLVRLVTETPAIELVFSDFAQASATLRHAVGAG